MGGNTILIVEDNPDIRSTLRHLFELEGYDVRLAEDGEAGLKSLEQGELPCLILLDLAMPRMDGMQFLERLHEGDSEAASIPVTVLSAQTDEAITRCLKDRFGCKVLSKPAPIATLLRTAKRCRDRRASSADQFDMPSGVRDWRSDQGCSNSAHRA